MSPVPAANSEAVVPHGRRFELVDGLRGIAALAVVLPHVIGLFVYAHASWLSQVFFVLADCGRSMVEVFFVVSGFAIAYSLRGAPSDGFSLGRFMLRRAVRLDPPYWFAMLWCGAVVAIRARLTHQPIEPPAVTKVLAHVFYVQDVLGIGHFNIVFWTLCMEFQLYLVFAAMMAWVTRRPRPPRDVGSTIGADTDRAGWAMLAAFSISLLASHTFWALRPAWFVPFFYLFLSGSLAAWRALGRISDRLLSACLLAMGAGLLLRPELARLLGFLTALLLYVGVRRGALHRWLSGRVVQWLGRISYSIYLIHAPLAIFFLGLRTRWSVDSEVVSLLCLAGTYACTIALASLLYATIEVPCLRLAQRLKESRPFAAVRLEQAPPR